MRARASPQCYRQNSSKQWRVYRLKSERQALDGERELHTSVVAAETTTVCVDGDNFMDNGVSEHMANSAAQIYNAATEHNTNRSLMFGEVSFNSIWNCVGTNYKYGRPPQ